MHHKPLFTSFEIFMISFIVVMICLWVGANLSTRMRAREEKKKQKSYRDRWNVLRSTEPANSSMSNRNNLTFKN